MKVVYCIDQNFVKPTLVSMMSLLENLSGNIKVLVIGHNLNPNAIKMLERVEGIYHHATVRHMAVTDDMLADNWNYDSFPIITAARLYIPGTFKSGRVLYLDGDTFIRKDVSPLFDMHMDGNLIAAARDDVLSKKSNLTESRTSEMAKIMGNHPMIEYFNSAVIMFDCGAIYKSELNAEILKTAGNIDNYTYPDQDFLNYMFKGKTKFIGTEWNTNPSRERLKIKPKIMHFSHVPKPWESASSSHFEHPHYMRTLGRAILEYRVNANRLLKQLLGEEADIMKDLDL